MVANGTSRFTQALSELKEEGSAHLVVGTVPDEKFGEATRSLLGHAEGGPRRRLFVTTEDKVPGIRDRIPDADVLPISQSVRVLAVGDFARSSSASAGKGNETLRIERIATDELDALAEAILEKIDEFERLSAGFEAAELRVSVDSLTTLIDTNGREAVFRMLHLLNHIIREKKGMAHYHLPVDHGSGIVRMFSPLFDSVIELRLDEDRLEQRWHLQDPEITSDWVEVDP